MPTTERPEKFRTEDCVNVTRADETCCPLEVIIIVVVIHSVISLHIIRINRFTLVHVGSPPSFSYLSMAVNEVKWLR